MKTEIFFGNMGETIVSHGARVIPGENEIIVSGSHAGLQTCRGLAHLYSQVPWQMSICINQDNIVNFFALKVVEKRHDCQL